MQFFLGDPAMAAGVAAAVAEQLDVEVGVGAGEGDLDGDGVGVARDGRADGPVLGAGVVVGDPVEPGLGAADGADLGLPGGGWMLIPVASKSCRPRSREYVNGTWMPSTLTRPLPRMPSR
jgi:hypothetical protein